jgi:predicted nucleic acid-binding protein
MSRVVFDTCVFIAYNPDFPPASFLSIVVVQEMMAGAADASQLKEWEATAKKFEKDDRLLVPTKEDWLLAGRVLNSMLRGLKSKHKGKTPKLPASEIQRIIRDVLIARTVKRAGCLLVTDNLSDFKRIKQFCNVRLMSGKEFFG